MNHNELNDHFKNAKLANSFQKKTTQSTQNTAPVQSADLPLVAAIAKRSSTTKGVRVAVVAVVDAVARREALPVFERQTALRAFADAAGAEVQVGVLVRRLSLGKEHGIKVVDAEKERRAVAFAVDAGQGVGNAGATGAATVSSVEAIEAGVGFDYGSRQRENRHLITSFLTHLHTHTHTTNKTYEHNPRSTRVTNCVPVK